MMNTDEYNRIIKNAKRLDRSLFVLSSSEKITKLEAILDSESIKCGETVIGVPLGQPYGGPAGEYIILQKRIYDKMRTSLRNEKINHVAQVIGVPYDKERFEINRKQLKKGFKISPGYVKFMKKVRNTATKIEIYKKPAFSFYP